MWVEMLVDLVPVVNRGAHGLGPDIRQDQGGSEPGWKVPEVTSEEGKGWGIGWLARWSADRMAE